MGGLWVVVQCGITSENKNFGGVSFRRRQWRCFCGTGMGLSGSLYLSIVDAWQFALYSYSEHNEFTQNQKYRTIPFRLILS